MGAMVLEIRPSGPWSAAARVRVRGPTLEALPRPRPRPKPPTGRGPGALQQEQEQPVLSTLSGSLNRERRQLHPEELLDPCVSSETQPDQSPCAVVAEPKREKRAALAFQVDELGDRAPVDLMGPVVKLVTTRKLPYLLHGLGEALGQRSAPLPLLVSERAQFTLDRRAGYGTPR